MTLSLAFVCEQVARLPEVRQSLLPGHRHED